MRIFCLIVLLLLPAGFHVRAAEAGYKAVLVTAETNFVRVRLPLTDVTGKVRVKEKTASGFGRAVAPIRTKLGARHYLEWQIGYDEPGTNSPSSVPAIQFIRKDETKYGHELSKLLFESLRLGLLSTNDLLRELAALKSIAPDDFEESQPILVEVSTNHSANGFHRAVQIVPQFTKTTPHGWVQIQLKPKQRAVGYQAMVYVCLPLDEVLGMDGEPRPPSPARSKETVYYDFTRENAPFLLDIVQAFGLASQQHNEDLQKILGKILEIYGDETAANRR